MSKVNTFKSLIFLIIFSSFQAQSAEPSNHFQYVKQKAIHTFVGFWQMINFSWLSKKVNDSKDQPKNKIPIVYHPDYNIGFFGLENIHPFESKKYGKVFKHLCKQLKLTENQFYKPEIPVSDEDLAKVHTPEYLESLNSSLTLAEITEISVLKYVPNFLLKNRLLYPMRLATQGTIDAAQLALKHGWAINLSGGYHHAKAKSGGGFCVYADIPLAIKKLREKNGNLTVLYIDLDAHQGNGVESILKKDKNIYFIDFFNEFNYPYEYKLPTRISAKPSLNDLYCSKHLKYAYDRDDFKMIMHQESQKSCPDCNKKYLSSLKKILPNALEEFKKIHGKNPDIIFYNAGTDCFEEDPLGMLKLSKQGIIDRDEFVFKQAKSNNIPLCMTLSGGYTQKSASIIGESIKNLFNKKLLTRNS
ncbi:MAG: histone deacetylase [Candidatus Babeliales bacterium]